MVKGNFGYGGRLRPPGPPGGFGSNGLPFMCVFVRVGLALQGLLRVLNGGSQLSSQTFVLRQAHF